MSALEEAALLTESIVFSAVFLGLGSITGVWAWFLQGGRSAELKSFRAAPYRRAFQLAAAAAAIGAAIFLAFMWLGKDNFAELFIENPPALQFTGCSINGVADPLLEIDVTNTVNGHKIIDMTGWAVLVSQVALAVALSLYNALGIPETLMLTFMEFLWGFYFIQLLRAGNLAETILYSAGGVGFVIIAAMFWLGLSRVRNVIISIPSLIYVFYFGGQIALWTIAILTSPEIFVFGIFSPQLIMHGILALQYSGVVFFGWWTFTWRLPQNGDFHTLYPEYDGQKVAVQALINANVLKPADRPMDIVVEDDNMPSEVAMEPAMRAKYVRIVQNINNQNRTAAAANVGLGRRRRRL